MLLSLDPRIHTFIHTCTHAYTRTHAAIFGLDVGGTLSKLVYFEQTRKSRKVERVTNSKRRFRYFEDPKKHALKRSQSLENLNTPRSVRPFLLLLRASGVCVCGGGGRHGCSRNPAAAGALD